MDLPEPLSTRPLRPADARAVFEVIRDAELHDLGEVVIEEADIVGEWAVPGYDVPDSTLGVLEHWEGEILNRPGFAPWQLRAVLDPAGEVVAMARLILTDDTTYVDRLATRRDQRGRGLAQALLVDASSRGRARGATVSELSTDSRTGALGLYERVGMVVTSTWVNRGITS